MAHWFIRPEIWFWCLMGQEFTVLLEVVLNDLNGEGLMHAGVACLTLISTPMWDPLVLVGLPWSFALVDGPLLVLFGGRARTADWFVVDVVLGIFVDLFEPGSGMFVDLHMILESFLPVFGLAVIQGGGSFIGCQGCISLFSSEMRFISRSIGGSLVFVDV